MTKTKLEKSVQSSMLDDLLDDKDKPQPPKPVTSYDSYGDYGTSYSRGLPSRRSGYQGSLLDDNGPDPLDDGYYNRGRRYTSPKPAYTPPASTGRFIAGGAAVAQAIQALEMGRNSGPKHYFLYPEDKQSLVNATVRALGEFFDAVGLCFGGEGVKNAKQLVADMLLNNLYYNTPSGGYKELDFGDDPADFKPTSDGTETMYDPITGEILTAEPEDIEREAIMNEGGQATEEE